jgi:hypothetical protein
MEQEYKEQLEQNDEDQEDQEEQEEDEEQNEEEEEDQNKEEQNEGEQEEQNGQEEQNEGEQQEEEPQPPADFYKIFSEFITDILNTFPEYTQIVSRWWTFNADQETKERELNYLINHCKTIFPERFFDILYKNEEMFKLENDNSGVNTEFLPGIIFKHLWNLNISENTKEIIWKYLQLILFAIIGNINDNSDFGDTAKLFEFINENELKQKLEEAFSNMSESFSNNLHDPSLNMDASFNIPSADDINEHINSMLQGKLGKLAMELTQETAEELGDDFDETSDSKKIFEKLFKNPTKMMNIIKKIGNKLDEKISSGEINESELMSEGIELLNKLKNTAGLGDMQKLFNQFNIPGMGKGSKMNFNAMESQMNRNMKSAKMKERFKQKLDAKRAQQELEKMMNEQTQQQQQTQQQTNDEELFKIFRSGDKPEKTMRIPKHKNGRGNKKNKK